MQLLALPLYGQGLFIMQVIIVFAVFIIPNVYSHILGVKNVLFLLNDLMDLPLSPAVVKRLTKGDAMLMMLKWAGEITIQNNKYLGLYLAINL